MLLTPISINIAALHQHSFFGKNLTRVISHSLGSQQEQDYEPAFRREGIRVNFTCFYAAFPAKLIAQPDNSNT